MIADLIIYNIKKIYTPYLNPPVRGKDMNKIKVIANPFIAVKDGKIIYIGTGSFENYINEKTILHDALNKVCLPGFIDSHSHLVHAGSREDEFALLRKNVSYLDILEAGGGILGTVQKTRKASFEELYMKAEKSLDIMMMHGVIALEAKSGYGLDLETEVKQLKVSNKLNGNHPIYVKSTYMGAHAIPKEFKNNRRKYIDQILSDMKYIKNLGLANSIDVFCENGVFSLNETEEILMSAKELGYTVKLHADEIEPMGGTKLGIKLGATSVDHLMASSNEDIILLGKSNTIANLLPGTSFYLRKKYANARYMIDNNVAISISGDYNPGSCPTENFQLIMQLAANYLKMTSEEILNAVTINPAYHMNIYKNKGSIEKSKDADIILLDIDNLDYLFYHFGINHVSDVFIKGKLVVKDRKVLRSK
ncbi:MAG: imidazolonepropionase [Bacilli bacterium]|jgi:imidazolonepropionase|nr:imidazolonepropionase [Bacilli bacterium]MDD2682227.1 imidazolonepropionase [Bacilli bacterium]MDD4063769.1 imidazolonepropionase [Bacilli bacterium]